MEEMVSRKDAKESQRIQEETLRLCEISASLREINEFRPS